MDVLIRAAVPEDCTALHRIDCAGNPSAWSEAQFLAAVANPHDTVLVAEQAGRAVGFIVWQTLFEESELHLIAVSPESRQSGIGSRLMEQWFQTGIQSGAVRFLLEVRAGNLTAQALYRKHGFAETARRRGYYPSPQGREDAVIMEKTC